MSEIKHVDESPKRSRRDSQLPVNTEALGLTIDHRKVEEERVHEHRENTRDNKQLIAEQEGFVLRIKYLLLRYFEVFREDSSVNTETKRTTYGFEPLGTFLETFLEGSRCVVASLNGVKWSTDT